MLLTKREGDPTGKAKIVLVGPIPRHEIVEAGQHVIGCKRPDGEALGDLYVQAAARRHGKFSLGSTYSSRYVHARPGKQRIMGRDHGRQGRAGISHGAHLLAKRSFRSAEQDLKIGSPARRPM